VNIVLIVIGTVVSTLFLGSAVSFATERTGWRAEAFHLLPRMGWGLPNTPGHYLDLCSAITGLILLPLGYILARRRQ
jgi:hypothetical protein